MLARLVLLIGLILGAAACEAHSAGATAEKSAEAAVSWRRTNYGWERTPFPEPPPPTYAPALHPGVVAAVQALLSLSLLLASCKPGRAKGPAEPLEAGQTAPAG